jgi:hypothetical protein
MEKKSNRGTLYLFAIVLILLVSCTPSRKGGTIQDKGKEIDLITKDYSVKALKLAPVEDTYVVFTANPVSFPDSIKYLDGYIIVIPQKDCDELKKQFGNFIDMQNAGHNVAVKKIHKFQLIAADKNGQKQLEKIIELNSRNMYPVIKLNMDELSVFELSYNNIKVHLSPNVSKQYLVKKIEILQRNYSI